MLTGAEKAAGRRLHGFVRSHDGGSVIVQFDAVAFSVGADDIGMEDEGQALEASFRFLFQFVAFVDAQPELVMRRSASAYLDFPDTEEGFGVVVVFREKGFQLFFSFGRERYLQHGISAVSWFPGEVTSPAAVARRFAACVPFRKKRRQD